MKVISETLRLGNVVRFLHRKALKDVRYRGRTSHIKLVFSMNDCRNLTRFEFFFFRVLKNVFIILFERL